MAGAGDKGCGCVNVASKPLPPPVAAPVCRPRPPGMGAGCGGASAPTIISKNTSSVINNSAVVGVFPAGYGFVVLTAIGSVMLVTWKAIKVGQARQEHKIPYPALYSPDNMTFNCIQRAHQNTMENLPQFLCLLLIGGMEMPYFCTLGGIIWIMGRIAYARGYYTGDPRKRSRGAFGILGMLMLLAATTKFAFRHLRG
ncbi:unnamed protein product [Allacma fusca]|uniref:Glutathione S-transferase 3, mitochondrial n=1 Tax=Allacma fusca TaxID=39272 RepID=A0A8J2PUP2_9HEXA|nr:unnamed protein product [Allacma fusca]